MNRLLSKFSEEAIATTRTVRVDNSVATTGSTITSYVAGVRPTFVKDKKIVDAVFGYIQAVRALGRTTINTIEVARALNLSPSDVERTLSSLSKKGVKISK
jgi:hypothetical protein